MHLEQFIERDHTVMFVGWCQQEERRPAANLLLDSWRADWKLEKSLIWQILKQISISFLCPGVLVVKDTTGEMFHSPTWCVVSDILHSNRLNQNLWGYNHRYSDKKLMQFESLKRFTPPNFCPADYFYGQIKCKLWNAALCFRPKSKWCGKFWTFKLGEKPLTRQAPHSSLESPSIQ